MPKKKTKRKPYTELCKDLFALYALKYNAKITTKDRDSIGWRLHSSFPIPGPAKKDKRALLVYLEYKFTTALMVSFSSEDDGQRYLLKVEAGKAGRDFPYFENIILNEKLVHPGYYISFDEDSAKKAMKNSERYCFMTLGPHDSPYKRLLHKLITEIIQKTEKLSCSGKYDFIVKHTFPKYPLPLPKVEAEFKFKTLGGDLGEHFTGDYIKRILTVSDVSEGISGGDPTHYVRFKELDGVRFNWTQVKADFFE